MYSFFLVLVTSKFTIPTWKDMNPSKQALVLLFRATWGLAEWPRPNGFESQEIADGRVNQATPEKIAHIVQSMGTNIYKYPNAS